MSVGQPRSFGNRFLTSDERVSNWIDLCRGELDSVLFFFFLFHQLMNIFVFLPQSPTPRRFL